MFGSKGGGDAVSLKRESVCLVSIKRKTDCLHRTTDFSQTRIRERQHCPWREEFFKLIAILPREGRAGHLPAPTGPLGEVLARIGRAAKRLARPPSSATPFLLLGGCKYTDGSPTSQPPLFPSAASAGVAAAQLLLPKIHEIETRRDPDPLRAQDRQQTMVMVAPGHLPRFIAQTPHRLLEMNPGDMGGLAEKRECGAHLSSAGWGRLNDS